MCRVLVVNKRREIITFVKDNFDTVDKYVESINKKGIREELIEFGVTLPVTLLSTEGMRKIYKIVLEEYIEKERGVR